MSALIERRRQCRRWISVRGEITIKTIITTTADVGDVPTRRHLRHDENSPDSGHENRRGPSWQVAVYAAATSTKTNGGKLNQLHAFFNRTSTLSAFSWNGRAHRSVLVVDVRGYAICRTV